MRFTGFAANNLRSDVGMLILLALLGSAFGTVMLVAGLALLLTGPGGGRAFSSWAQGLWARWSRDPAGRESLPRRHVASFRRRGFGWRASSRSRPS